MTFEDINAKYGDIDSFLEKADVKAIREYKNDCFEAYEQSGFCDTFTAPYEDKTFDGQPFEVIGRVPELSEDHPDGADIECLPMWFIEIKGGHKTAAYPEEICRIEREKSCGNVNPVDYSGKV